MAAAVIVTVRWLVTVRWTVTVGLNRDRAVDRVTVTVRWLVTVAALHARHRGRGWLQWWPCM